MANPTINWLTKVISVPQSFLTPLGGTNYSLDTNAFHIALRDLEDDADGIVFPPTHNHNTVVSLGGIQYARIIEIINGYTITFENGVYSVSLLGSNNNILDSTNLNSVQLRSNNSAGLINVAEIQFTAFAGAVHVDVANGFAGTLYPAGTPLRPVNNFADAKIIAAGTGLNALQIIGSATMGAGADFDTFLIKGQSANLTQLILDPACNVANCEIRDCYVTGTLDGGTIIRECMVSTLNFVNGALFNTMLNAGTITLGGGPSASFHLLECYSGVPGTSTPIIDCAGNGPALGIRGYNGGLKITNKSGAAAISIDMNSGSVFLDSTVTAGDIVVRGVGALTNNSVGANVLSSSLLSPTSIWAHATAAALIADIAFVKGIEGGRWKIIANQMIFYAADNITEIARFDLKDANGVATMTNPMERARV